MSRRTLVAALGLWFAFQTGLLLTGAEIAAQLSTGSQRVAQGTQMQTHETRVAVFDPTKQSPSEMVWQPYPAAPPVGFHWQHTGSLAIKLDPATGQPLSGQRVGSWILVRDGYSMPKVR